MRAGGGYFNNNTGFRGSHKKRSMKPAQKRVLFLYVHGGNWHHNADAAWHWLLGDWFAPMPARYLNDKCNLWTVAVYYPLALVPMRFRYQYLTAVWMLAMLLSLIGLVLISRFTTPLSRTLYIWASLFLSFVSTGLVYVREFIYGGSQKHRSINDYTSHPIYLEQLDSIGEAIEQACEEHRNKRIVLVGMDAGGHLLALWALQRAKLDFPSQIAAVVTSDAIYNIVDMVNGPLTYTHWYSRHIVAEPAFGKQGKVWRSASPQYAGGRESLPPLTTPWYVCVNMFGSELKQVQARDMVQKLGSGGRAPVHHVVQIGMNAVYSRQFRKLLEDIETQLN